MHHPIDSALSFVLLVGIVSGSFAYVYARLPPQGYIGISGTDVSAEIAQQMHLSEARGFLIVQVEIGSPADKAGLKGGDRVVQTADGAIRIGGDVITAADGQQIQATNDLKAVLKTKNVGDKITFTIVRGGNGTMNIPVTIEPRARSIFP